jgi:LmbE family N-acetylglucosaminyl deacetylase
LVAEATLVIAAHPDDEVLGCGGMMARLADAGEDVFVAILGEGITSRYGARSQADPTLITDLRSASKRAVELLGARELFLYDLPDNRFDTVPLLDIVKIVESLVERLRPESIYTHHPGDLNVDHPTVFRAVLTATRPISTPVRKIYAFEVPSATDWSFNQFVPFRPNVFVDIAASLDRKIAAMEIYESEARPFPHPRSPEALEALARQRGASAGLAAAEGFELVREIR